MSKHDEKKDDCAVNLGSRGGNTRKEVLSSKRQSEIARLGGHARAAKLTSKERTEIAQQGYQGSVESRGKSMQDIADDLVKRLQG